jgi:hypothetical protein
LGVIFVARLAKIRNLSQTLSEGEDLKEKLTFRREIKKNQKSPPRGDLEG